MHVIIATEIFGINPAVESLAEDLKNADTEVSIVDPYDGVEQKFECEQDAYDQFIGDCGHDGFYSRIEARLLQADQATILIGFSVGASAGWRVLAGDSGNLIQHFVGFYPTQIRHHLDIDPACPSSLIFPAREEHFELDPVIDRLSSKAQVKCHKTDYLHGFMNPQSMNFEASAARQYFTLLSSIKQLLAADQFLNALKRC